MDAALHGGVELSTERRVAQASRLRADCANDIQQAVTRLSEQWRHLGDNVGLFVLVLFGRIAVGAQSLCGVMGRRMGALTSPLSVGHGLSIRPLDYSRARVTSPSFWHVWWSASLKTKLTFALAGIM